jgi:PAS domain S-box-containing protein
MAETLGRDDPVPAAQALDVHAAIDLSRRGLFDRVAFASVYAAISLFILPWTVAAGWVAAILVWELIVTPPLDRIVGKMPKERALGAYVALGVVGGSLYQAVAFLCLANGSPVGVAMGATWICGSVLNIFVYAGPSRLFLIGDLAPVALAATVGPALAYGLDWKTAIVPAALALNSVAVRRFSLDHAAIVGQLADRQSAFADIESKLSVAIEASGDGLFEADLITNEFHASPNWLAMIGYAPDEVASPIRDWRAFVHPDDVPLIEKDYLAHFSGATPHTASELRMRCKDGAYKWVLSRGRLVARTPEGRPLRLVGTTIDISDRKALEHQLESARDLAESANRAKSVFVANMSHEIRTPLNGVIGIAGALAGCELPPQQREMVALIQSSGQMLDRMLSDILDQAKIEAGDFQLQVAPFDLRGEIDGAAAMMRARAVEKGLEFQVAYGDSARGHFAGDAVRLKQIISNLAFNAIKFTSAGHVTITIDAVDPASPGTATTLRIEVADSGIGFDEEAAGRLFGRFVQADGSISRQFGGTGLGLAICKALTDLMNGQITAASTPDVGSVFTVEIPLARVAAVAEPPPHAASVASTSPLIGLRVLLAEDHAINQRVVQLILEPMGVELSVVVNGQEALDIFRPGLFDLILMDMQMPVMDGLTATRAIRRLEADFGSAPIPIAMFTANAMDEHLALAVEAGANHHIAKPITPGRLLAGIEHALSDGWREEAQASLKASA